MSIEQLYVIAKFSKDLEEFRKSLFKWYISNGYTEEQAKTAMETGLIKL